ncbi:MAG: hypothetical protein N3A56_08080 [Thermodesulfobacteriaceae bacterium]|nr:hypothetical protein [Candidatus Aenigmarchaeota archaeon]MCX8042425.1 hypothetical protein [Thermodesulfobacteriaceae bacterium]
MKESKNYFKNRVKGFLLLEILVSALILAGAVAAGMYLFRVGFQYLEKIKENNLLSSKVPQALSYIYKAADLNKGEGNLLLGEEVELKWKATLLEKVRPQIPLPETGFSTPYELYLYEVEFTLSTKKLEKTYNTFVTKYKMLTVPIEGF